MKVKFIIFIFSITWLALLTRVFFLSVESNSHYSKLSQNNTIKLEKIVPVRGEILDNHNRPVAINKLGFKIQLAPHLSQRKSKDKLDEEITYLKKLLPFLDVKKMKKNYMKKESYYNHSYIDVVHFIPYKEIIPVYSLLNLRKNIKIVSAPKRYYPFKNIGAHMIGYVAHANRKDIEKDKLAELIGYIGKTGIEKYYNNYLQGKPGIRKIQVNANNEEIAELMHTQADEDTKLTLSLDMELQSYISKLFEGKVGAIVVMNVDGSILAAGSFPNYDLNIFVNGMSHKMYNEFSQSLDHPFTNKLIHGLYPPGSSIKPLLGLIYITEGLSPSWTVYCTSSLHLGGRIFRCWKRGGHKKTNITKAIRESCDDYFYKGSLVIGNRKMSMGLKRFGLAKKSGVDLPNEFIGVVPSRAWKRKKYNKIWNIGETANMAIGQGDFLVTPLQIAQQTALIATGKLPTPHFAKMIGNKAYKSTFRDVLTKKEHKYLPTIRHAMYEVCNYPKGTATSFIHSKVTIAGKTGTAQIVGIKQDIKRRKQEHEMAYYNRSHAWLTTYGPYKDPQYVVMAMVEHGGHGGHAAGGIVSKIYNKLLELGYIKSKKRRKK